VFQRIEGLTQFPHFDPNTMYDIADQAAHFGIKLNEGDIATIIQQWYESLFASSGLQGTDEEDEIKANMSIEYENIEDEY
jgi:hypothetical protein